MSVAAGMLPMVAHAQPGRNPFDSTGAANANLGTVGSRAGIGAATPLPVIIGNIINVVLGFLGIVLLFYLIYGGFKWMTSGGSEDGVKQAKTMIQNAIIGLVIIVSSYAISTFVLGQLLVVTTG